MTTKNRPLPPNVNGVPDRHGKIRYRYRRSGVPGGYLPGEPWSPQWLEKLAFYQGQVAPEKNALEVRKRYTPFSMDDLASKLRGTGRWKRQAEDTRKVYGSILDRLMERTNKRGQRFGDRDARRIDVASLEKLLGKMADRPGAATKWRNVLNRLFKLAAKLGWRSDNPAALTDPIPQQGEGFHTWTEGEIEQYRTFHALGTTPRLVVELALNTAARRCNLPRMERSQIVNGTIEIQHAKGNEVTVVELMAEARAAIDAMPTTPIRYLIVNAFGKPFSVAGLGNAMRKWADQAGLEGCSLHGLRKAQSRRLAEAGATNAEGRAVTGHKKDATFDHYTKKASRKRLATNAMAKLRGSLSNLEE